MRPLLLACLFAVLLTGCLWREGRAWPPAQPAAATPVVFAPLDLGPLAAIHPQARSDWALDLAARLLVATRSAEGYAAVDWPGSADAAWERGLPADAPAAGYVVLTRIIAIEDTSTPAVGPRRTATASMRVLDAQGRVAWSKRARVDSPVQDLAKLPGPEAKPESRAAWAACSATLGALGEWLAARDDRAAIGVAPVAVVAPMPGPGEVAVAVGSQPDHADVLVDGVLRGTTPCTIVLPAGASVRLRLERAGCQPWERAVLPAAGLSLAPALAPAPAPAVATP